MHAPYVPYYFGVQRSRQVDAVLREIESRPTRTAGHDCDSITRQIRLVHVKNYFQ